jgi:hypothetical protein
MTDPFIIGVLGGLVLVAGAAWPIKKHIKHPIYSVKNWLFGLGAVIMLLFSILGFVMQGEPIFFVFLEALVVLASLLMMMNVPDKIDIPIIGVSTILLVSWSLVLFEGANTVAFIIGLAAISLGYTLDMGSLRRNLALTVGSILLTIFSLIEASWVFFWLNLFFGIFSGYYVFRLGFIKMLRRFAPIIAKSSK